ncbi:serotransferrin-like [Salmo trutta]|uniref:serotransferrin-like n=1 Tax=Salmo trutta TaxID=8032 RepID=UPI001131A9CF|nr:serotransferrin-like [Salmo trutta]
MGTLVTMGQIKWAGIEDKPVEEALQGRSQAHPCLYRCSCVRETAPGLTRNPTMTMPGPSRLQPVSSDGYAAKNLMFKDSTQKLVQLPMNTDSFLWELKQTTGATSRAIKWCAVGHAETAKCGTWSINSIGERGAMIECQRAPTLEECIRKIMFSSGLGL